MLSPAMQGDGPAEGDKENKITKREWEKQVYVMAKSGDNERGNHKNRAAIPGPYVMRSRWRKATVPTRK
jgi:hypothetical protein